MKGKNKTDRQNISINKVVEGIIALLGNKAEFPIDDEKIQESFFKLANNSKYKNLLAGLKFSEGTLYHKSLILENIFDNLLVSRLLTIILDKYQITTSLYNIYKRKIKSFFKEKENLIEEASKEFNKLIKGGNE